MSASSTGKIAVALVLMAGAATALLLACRAQARLREQNRLLERRIQELARAARPGQLVPAQTGLDLPLSPQEESELLRLRGEVGVLRREKSELSQLQADNRRLRQTFFSELLNGNARLDLQQLAPYLEAKQRNAGSLLAAWRATGQQALLQEATDKYPGEPRARLAACLAWSATDGTSRDERRSRLEAFKQSAPDNALAYYLSAEAYFENDQPDRALREMAAVPANARLQDYSGDAAQNVEEAYLAAGFSAVEAETLAAYGRQSSPWSELVDLGQNLADLARHCRDETSAQAALQMGAALAQHVSQDSDARMLIQDLAGVDIESRILAAASIPRPWGNPWEGVKERLDELAQRRQSISVYFDEDRLTRLQESPEPDQLSFFARVRSSGELEALRWLQSPKSP